MKISAILILSLVVQMHQTIEGAEGKRTVRIVFPERPNNAPKSAFFFNGKKSMQIMLPSANLSEIIDLPPGEISVLMTPEKIKDPGNLPVNAPKLAIAGDVRDFYILVTPDPGNQILPIRMILLNANGAKLNNGETLWHNETNLRIIGKLGEKILTVEPNAFTVTNDPVPKSGFYRAEFSYQIPGQEESHGITEQQWWHDANSRHLGFIVSTGGRLPKIFFYRDFR